MNPGALQQVTALIDQGKLAAAESQLTRLLARDAKDPNLNSLMGYVAALSGKREQALYYAERARHAAPDHPGLLANHASALARLGRFAEVIELLGSSKRPGALIADSYTTLTNAHLQTRRFEEALSLGREGVERHPDAPGVVGNLAMALQHVGCADEALGLWRRASDLDPRSLVAAAGLITCSLYAQSTGGAQVASDLARVDAAVRAVFEAPAQRWEVDPDPDRPLRVGLLSGDLRRHAMAFFIEPILRSYDRARWRLTCYHTGWPEDDVTARLRPLAGEWREEHATSDRALAERIRKDRIDVLLDLAGHTAGGRPGALHSRPAPVQIFLLAYPGSLGMSSIQARISDDATDPAGAGWPGPERLVRIDPCAFAYAPPPDAPEPAEPPSARSGSVTFGSFASLQKITDQTLDLWARAMNAVPGSRLLIRNSATGADATRARLRDRLVRAGAPSSRLLIEGPLASARETLAEYSRVDVALDTFPYHGTTTTCESLWMGVPIVMLEGRSPAARVGCALLRTAGVPDVIATSPNDYVRIASELATDLKRRRAFRATGSEGLRQRVRGSALCDTAACCRRLEAAVADAWRAWCTAARSG